MEGIYVEFEFEEEPYYVIVWTDGKEYIVKAYKPDHSPANPYEYRVEYELDHLFYQENGHPVIDHLVDLAIKDVVERTYERLNKPETTCKKSEEME